VKGIASYHTSLPVCESLDCDTFVPKQGQAACQQDKKFKTEQIASANEQT
jgi:hypothetical protein